MSPKVVAVAGGCVDMAHAVRSGQKKPARRLKRQSTDEAVSRAIDDSLEDLLPEEIDGHRNAQGQTVVTQRKRLHREDPAHFPIGAKFYAEVRRAFKRQPASAQLLQPRDDDGDVTPMLLSAMVAFKKTGNRSPFAGCLRLLEEISWPTSSGCFAGRWSCGRQSPQSSCGARKQWRAS